MTAASKRHLQVMHELPCVVCLNCYGKLVRATEAHHLEFVRGEHSSFATVPLCESCHDAMHENRRRSFYLAHKLDDVKILSLTIKLIWEYAKWTTKFLKADTGGGCSVCSALPVVNAGGTYWLCGACVTERLDHLRSLV